MAAGAISLAIRATSAARIARSVADAANRLQTTSGALVLLGGSLASKLQQVARALGEAQLGFPLLVASGAGILTEDGELENESGAAVLVYTGGHTLVHCVEADSAAEMMQRLSRLVADSVGNRSCTVGLFVRPDGFEPGLLHWLRQLKHITLFGAGTIGSPTTAAIQPDGTVQSGHGCAFVLQGSTPPVVRYSSACRLLTPLRRVTETRGSLVVRIEDEPALDVLSSAGEQLFEQQLIFAALASGHLVDAAEGRVDLIVRPVQGVDPVRRALMISEEVRADARIAFAVRDGRAARDDLQRVARQLRHELAGAAPRFGIYINCAGRGPGLYGASDVDTRILREHLGRVPLVGMQSSFEIAPYDGAPTLQLYTGVLALFTAAS